MSLQAFDAANVLEHAELAEKMIRKLRAGMMPPAGARRPDAATCRRAGRPRSRRESIARRRSIPIPAGVRRSA